MVINCSCPTSYLSLPSVSFVTSVVQPGETVDMCASMYNTTVAGVLHFNIQIHFSTLLLPGTILSIPLNVFIREPTPPARSDSSPLPET